MKQNYSTERLMDIAILESQTKADEHYNRWLSDFLGSRQGGQVKSQPAQQPTAPQPPEMGGGMTNGYR